MYMFEICVEGIFVTFPWSLENVKSRSKIALFSNECHFEIWFPKKRKITFCWSKWSQLHKQSILQVATTFSLKQGGNKNKPWTHSTPLLALKHLGTVLTNWFVEGNEGWAGAGACVLILPSLSIRINYNVVTFKNVFVWWVISCSYLLVINNSTVLRIRQYVNGRLGC